jgi:hypothetical protein
MPYIFNGQPIDEAFVIEAAEVEGLSIEDYVNQKEGLEFKKDPVDTDPFLKNVKKQMGPAEEAAPVGPVNQPRQDGESTLEDSLLELPQIDIDPKKKKAEQALEYKNFILNNVFGDEEVLTTYAGSTNLITIFDENNGQLPKKLRQQINKALEGPSAQKELRYIRSDGTAVYKDVPQNLIGSPRKMQYDALEDTDFDAILKLTFEEQVKKQQELVQQNRIASELAKAEELGIDPSVISKKYEDIDRATLSKADIRQSELETILADPNTTDENKLSARQELDRILKGGLFIKKEGLFIDPATDMIIGKEEADKKQGLDLTDLYKSNVAQLETYTDKDLLRQAYEDFNLETAAYVREGNETSNYLIDNQLVQNRLQEQGFKPIMITNGKDKGRLLYRNVPLNVISKYSVILDNDSSFTKGNRPIQFDAIQPVKIVNNKIQHDGSAKEYANTLVRYTNDGFDIKARREAFKQVYLLNKSPEAINRGWAFGKGIIDALPIDKDIKQHHKIAGLEVLNQVNAIAEDAGITLSEEQKKATKMSFGEDVSYGAGGMVPILGEFFLLNKGQAVATAATKFRTLSGELISVAGYLNKLQKSKRLVDKAKALGILAGLEETKTQIVGFDTGSGAGFAVAGKALSPLKISSKYNQLNTFVNKVLMGGVSFPIASEAAGNLEALVRDAQNVESYQTYINENYGDYSEVGKRALHNVIMGMGLGVTHLKSKDIKTTQEINKLYREAQNKFYEATAKGNEQDAQKHAELILEIDAYKEQANLLDSYSTKEKAKKAIKKETDAINKTLEEAGGKKFEVEVVEDSSAMLSEKDKANVDKNNNRLIINKNKVEMGVLPHEGTHMAWDALFKGRPEFKAEILSMLESIAGKIKLNDGRSLLEAIKQDKNITAEKFQEELFGYTAEYLSKPEYYTDFVSQNAFKDLKLRIQNFTEKRLKHKPKIKTEQDLIDFLGRWNLNIEGGKSAAKQAERFNELIDRAVPTTETVASRNLQLEKSNLIAERTKIIEAQKELAKAKGPKEKIDANVARIAEIKKELDKLDKNIKIAESNAKNTDIIKRELPLAEERAKANQDFRKDALGNILKDSKGEPMLDVSKYKSALLQNAESNLLKDNQAIIQKEINKFDPKLGGDKTLFEGEILKNFSDLIKTYSAEKGEFGAYLRANLPKRTPTAFEVVGQRKAGREDLFEADVTEAKGIEAAEVDVEISSGRATDKQFEAKTPFQGQQKGKGFILGKNTEIPKEIKDAIEAEILEGAKNLDFENLNYGNIPNLAKKSIKKLFGKPKDRVQFLRNEAEGLYALLPEPAMKQAVTRTKSATGIAKTGLKVFYPETGLGRVTQEKERVSKAAGTAAGLIERTKLPFNKQLWLDTFGINKGQKQTRNQAESLQRTLEDAIGKAITNYTIRQIEGIKPETIQRIADGKSDVLASSQLGFDKNYLREKVAEIIQSNVGTKGFFANGIKDILDDHKINHIINIDFIQKQTIKNNRVDKKIINEVVANQYLEQSKELIKYFPKELDSQLIKGFMSLHYKNNGEGMSAKKISERVNEKGEKIKGTPDYTRIYDSTKNNLGKNTHKSWEELSGLEIKDINKLQSALKRADKLQVDGKGKQAAAVVAEAFEGINNKTRVKIYDAIQQSLEQFINDAPDATSRNARIEHVARVKRYNTNVISGERQLMPVLAYQPAGIGGPKKTEHLKAMILQNLESFDAITNPTKSWKEQSSEVMKDAGVIIGDKYIMDIMDKVGGKINPSNVDRLLLVYDKLNEFVTVDSKGKQTLQDYYLNNIAKELNIPKNKINLPFMKDVVMEYIGNGKTMAGKLLIEKISNASKIEQAAYKEELRIAKNSRAMASTELKGASKMQLIGANKKKQQEVVNNIKQQFASTDLNKEFNQLILRPATGFKGSQKIGAKRASIIGKGKGKWDIIIGPKSDDFVGLLYRTLGKGAQGEAQMEFYKKNLLDPYVRGVDAVSRNRVKLLQSVKQLGKQLSVAPRKLKKAIPEAGGFTGNQVMQLYIWNKLKYDIPDLTKTELKSALDYIKTAPELQAFADQLITLTDGKYQKPGKNWEARNIVGDLIALNNEGVRSEYLKQFNENKDIIFSKENLNKLEATYGTSYREALENSLKRMESGRNRSLTGNKIVDKFQEWINGAVGTTMFFNSRSAVLQTISTANYINWSDNNPLAAGKAFANIPQYTKDFKMIFNSDYLVNRRGGLKINVEDAQIAELAQQGGVQGFFSKLLKKGFLPTQIADSFAISAGGATFYRNRVNTYLKQGMKLEAAELNAFRDFQKATEESQQSSDPSKISMEQASTLGRTILAYANTPSQYARLSKKAVLDLYNRRGSDKENLSKLAYYTFMQNLIFNTLQKGLFALAFDGDEYPDASIENKAYDVANGMSDSILRGMGIPGASVSTVKNVILRLQAESEKKRPKYSEAAWNLLDLSPPIDSKVSRIRGGLRSYEFNSKKMKEMGPTLDNPFYMANAQIISGATNIPLDRLLLKYDNVSSSLDQDRELWQRTALLMGWPDWQLEPPKAKKPKALSREQKKKKQEKERKKNILKRFE